MFSIKYFLRKDYSGSDKFLFCNHVLMDYCFQADIMDEDKRLVSAVDYYFIEDDGGRFKVCTSLLNSEITDK